jgi:hypothetical protein
MPDADVSSEWSAAQARYMLRAAQQSARALDLYYSVLHRVALGTLTPAAIRDALASVAETHGPSYAAKLGAVSARFFSALLQLTTGAADAPPPFDPANPALWFAQLSEYANANARGAVRRYERAVERVAVGEITSGELQAEIANEYARRGAEQMRALGTIYFDLLGNLSEIGAEFEHEYFRRLLSPADPAHGGVPAVALTGAIGDRSSAALTLENTRSERATIRCIARDVRRVDGVGPAFTPVIAIDPDAVALEPGQESEVRISLLLDGAVFAPGAVYVGALQILRAGEAPLDVPLRIVASISPNAPATRAGGAPPDDRAATRTEDRDSVAPDAVAAAER